jgi:predicted alpha/beta superfamily hydrolase
MRHAVMAVLLLIAAALAFGGEPITIGETVKIQSKILGEERTILISTPPNYARSQEKYPVLYMTDGDAHLTHTRGTVDFLARNGVMPNLIIVAITNTDRTRDLSPTPGTRRLPDGTTQPIPNSGGAAKFLEFFDKELFPYVEGNYRTEPYRIFAGHSLGGLLALYTVTARPDMFNAVIAASPALNWDSDFIVRRTGEFFKARKELARTLFVTMANEEEGEPSPTRFEKLRTILASSKADGFVWGYKAMPEETHGTVVLRSHYWGLRKIFEGWQLPLDREVGFRGGLTELKQHFAGLSKRFGFEVVPSEPLVNQIGYQMLGRDDIEGAIAVFRYNVELRPGSANVYDSLAEALGRGGKTEESLANYEKAVARAKETADPLLYALIANRDRAVAAAKAKKPSP